MLRLSSCAAAVVSVCLLIGSAAPAATSTVYTTDQLRNTLQSASPGDRIYVAPGTYTQHLWAENVHGAPGNLIEVVALDPTNRPVFQEQSSGVFTLYQSSYVLVDGIIVRGAGTPSSSGNNICFTFSHHMILRNSVSGDITHTGNSDGLKFAGSDNLLIHNCVVEDWGEGGSGVDCVGARDSLFMRNSFAFASLATGASANGLQPKGGTYNMGFYKNRFTDGSSRAQQFGGSTGDAYWHQGNRAQGWEGFDMVSMGNFFDAGEAAVAYVSCTGCEVSHNTIVDPEKWVMRILKEGGDHETAGNSFDHNLVEYGPVSSIQNVGSSTQPTTFSYDGNFWYNSLSPGTPPALYTGCVRTNDVVSSVSPQLDGDYRPHLPAAKHYGAHSPEAEAAWQQHTQDHAWFDWAWDRAQEIEPDAHPGGSYQVGPGGSVTLDAGNSFAGSGSYDDDAAHPEWHYTITDYAWDLDWDSDFDDGAGETVVLSYEDLTGTGPGQLGLELGSHTIELQITVSTPYGEIVDWGFAELEIVPEPITLWLLAAGGLGVLRRRHR